ncbi:TPA: hypothetical protein SMO80_000484 [Proteus mirabilis]|nr:hypothetical protein [Proteus mirabilis]
MSTIPTQNPVPSEAAKDLKFNSGKIDEFVTSMKNKYIDRFGQEHFTIEGLRWVAQQAISQFGYITLESFQKGAEITLPNQVLRDEATGEYYRWDGALPKFISSNSTPENSGGIGIGKWLGVGDASLRSELTEYGGCIIISNSITTFNSLNEARGFTRLSEGKEIKINGYNNAGDGGDSSFIVVDKSSDIGIPTHDGRFKLKRISGHDWLYRIIRNGTTTRYVAHRGWQGDSQYAVPENTMAAINFCAERGAFGIEGDTKISKDGVAVIFHDSTLSRVTSGKFTGSIGDYTYDQLKNIDVGSYASPLYQDERILNYDEWLYGCKMAGIMPFAEWSTTMTNEQADSFLSSVKKYYGNKPCDVFISSTVDSTLRLLRSKNAYIGLGVMGAYGVNLPDEKFNLAYELGNSAIHLNGNTVLNSDQVKKAQERDLLIFSGIPNNFEMIRNCINASVDVVVTDFYRG